MEPTGGGALSRSPRELVAILDRSAPRSRHDLRLVPHGAAVCTVATGVATAQRREGADGNGAAPALQCRAARQQLVADATLLLRGGRRRQIGAVALDRVGAERGDPGGLRCTA